MVENKLVGTSILVPDTRKSEHLTTLSTSLKGWTKELNMVSWNDAAPKYDLREWSPDHSKMGKGITLTKEELERLISALEKTQ